jgi:hypothetical protein
LTMMGGLSRDREGISPKAHTRWTRLRGTEVPAFAQSKRLESNRPIPPKKKFFERELGKRE